MDLFKASKYRFLNTAPWRARPGRQRQDPMRQILETEDHVAVPPRWTLKSYVVIFGALHPILKVWNQLTFETADLQEFMFAISIQGKGSHPAVLRTDFQGRRLNLYFDDVLDGPGAAVAADIEALVSFGQEWLAEMRQQPSTTVVLHCAAGISRSGAAAMTLLSLYFGTYQAAATYLFRTHPHLVPNVWICRLIFERLGPSYGTDIFEALAKGKEEASRTAQSG
jgi:predicted protein tyrosine phosphatase